MRKQLVVLTAFFLSPLAAQAEGPGFIDLYFVPSAKLEYTDPGLGTFSDSGTGFGIKGLVPASEFFAITGEYQATNYDDSDIDVDQLRVGIGLTGPTTSGLYVEYIAATVDDLDEDGFGLHLRLAGRPSDAASFYGQAGYLALDNDFETDTGFEFTVGAAIEISGNMGVFADLRRTTLEGEDSEFETELTDVRAGLRLRF